MILLVVGLVAVIAVILIAVFLSIRLGRGDEDDELDTWQRRGRRHTGEEDWRERDLSDERWASRPARAASRRSDRAPDRGADDYHRRGERAGYGARSSVQERDHMSRPSGDWDHDGTPHRDSRRTAPEYDRPAARRRGAVTVSAESQGRGRADRSRWAGHDDRLPADHPSADLPAVDYPAEPAPAQGKGRSRQRRSRRDDRSKRDDDAWPSTDWDHLSDEQYWAELSADKPLAAMARPAQSPAGPRATSPKSPASGKSVPDEPGTLDSGPPRAAAAAARQFPPDLPGRREQSPEIEPDAYRLPVRSRPEPAVVAAEPPAASPQFPMGQLGQHPSLDTEQYARSRDTGRHPSLDTEQYVPSRDTGRHPSLDTGTHVSPDLTLAMLSGPGRPASPAPSAVPDALDDDPLTSPSFSLKAGPATDSRSYGHARQSTPAARPGPVPGNGTGGAGWPGADSYPAGYENAYPADAAPAAEWYSAAPAPAAPVPAYGDPYDYSGSTAASPPAGGFGEGRPDTGYNGSYLTDPLHAYSQPAYEAQAAYPDPASPHYQALPALSMAPAAPDPASHAPYPDHYQGHPNGHGLPDPGPYPDGYGGTYPSSFEGNYGTGPYAGEGHSGYQPFG